MDGFQREEQKKGEESDKLLKRNGNEEPLRNDLTNCNYILIVTSKSIMTRHFGQ